MILAGVLFLILLRIAVGELFDLRELPSGLPDLIGVLTFCFFTFLVPFLTIFCVLIPSELGVVSFGVGFNLGFPFEVYEFIKNLSFKINF